MKQQASKTASRQENPCLLIMSGQGKSRAGAITISQERYEELLRKEARLEEAEQRAEQAEEHAEECIQTQMQGLQKLAHFWFQAWTWVAGLLHNEQRAYQHLKAKLSRRDRLMRNKGLKPEQRAYIYAAAEVHQETKKVDTEGRAYVNTEQIAERAGLPESTCRRVRKELEAAGHLQSTTYTRHGSFGVRKDRFEKLSDAVYEAPDALECPDAPKRGGFHPRCASCESDDTLIEKKTIQVVTCRACGERSTTILPVHSRILNPVYAAQASPGRSSA